jgi:hypothetical protein
MFEGENQREDSLECTMAHFKQVTLGGTIGSQPFHGDTAAVMYAREDVREATAFGRVDAARSNVDPANVERRGKLRARCGQSDHRVNDAAMRG